MIKLNQIAFLSIACCCLSLASQANETTIDWIANIDKAFAEKDYKGTFIYLRSGKIDTFRIVHRFTDGKEQERLSYLNGPIRELLSDNDKLFYVTNAQGGTEKQLPFENPFPRVTKENLASVIQQYDVIRANSMARIAGHLARRVLLKSVDAHRYSHHFWLDNETGFLLKYQLIGVHGEVLEQLQFVEIDFNPRITEQSFVIADGLDTRLLSKIDNHIDDSNTHRLWQVGWLPDGFNLLIKQHRKSPAGTELVEQRIFSDGLTSISIYVEPFTEQASVYPPTTYRRGATLAYSMNEQSHHVTVVGEIPDATAVKIARSISINETSLSE